MVFFVFVDVVSFLWSFRIFVVFVFFIGWLVVINVVRYMEEKKGVTRIVFSMRMFDVCIRECDLIDIFFMGV